MYRLRTMAVIGLLITTLSACGGGGDGSSDDTSGSGTDPTTAASTPDTTDGADSTETTSGDGEVVIGSGDGTAEYTLSGGVESSGELALIPSMTFYSEGVWTLSFGSEGGSLLLIGLDPSTPSVNLTDGVIAASGDTSNCDFDFSQDADTASGSFTCSNVSAIEGGVLKQAEEFSGTFSANP